MGIFGVHDFLFHFVAFLRVPVLVLFGGNRMKIAILRVLPYSDSHTRISPIKLTEVLFVLDYDARMPMRQRKYLGLVCYLGMGQNQSTRNWTANV